MKIECKIMIYNRTQYNTIQIPHSQWIETSEVCSRILISSVCRIGTLVELILHCTQVHCTVVLCTVLNCIAMYCSVIHCWPGWPNDPSTIRVASVIAFSFLCLSVFLQSYLFLVKFYKDEITVKGLKSSDINLIENALIFE